MSSDNTNKCAELSDNISNHVFITNKCAEISDNISSHRIYH
jgi:hypothetical protein